MIGYAFPFGFAFITLLMTPIDGNLLIFINAALALGLAFLGWRLLPPRLTVRSFILFVAAWIALSVVTFPLAVEIMVQIGKRRYET